MKSICLSLAAAATIALALAAAPVSNAVASGHAVAPPPAPVAPPRVVVPNKIVPLPPKPRVGITRRKVTSFAQLPPKLRAQIRRGLQPFLKKRMASLGIVPGGGSNAEPPTAEELDALCDEWLVIYDEDANGDPVPGSAKVDCDGIEVWP